MLCLQMSWNTMMEGFSRHEKETGQNPLEMAKEQNSNIQKELEKCRRQELEAKIEELRKSNLEKEAELERQRREVLERERFYLENGPPQVQGQVRVVFQERREDEDEDRIVEIEG